jgi:transposase InsO family protein
MISVNQS